MTNIGREEKELEVIPANQPATAPEPAPAAPRPVREPVPV